jgi:hypothetical protein
MLGGKALATGAGGASRQTQDPSADMWKNPVGNIGVKICQSLFGDARLRPENPFGMRDREPLLKKHVKRFKRLDPFW